MLLLGGLGLAVVVTIAATVVILVMMVDKSRRPAAIEALVPVLVALVTRRSCRPGGG